MITFSVPIVPKGKARHRTANGHVYTPQKQVHWEAQFALFSSQYKPAQPMEGPLWVEIVAVFPRPKRLRRKVDVKERPGLLPMDKKPDCDNVGKSVLDSLQTMFFRDDCTITSLKVEKYYEEITGEGPRIEIKLGFVEKKRPVEVIGNALDCTLAPHF